MHMTETYDVCGKSVHLYSDKIKQGSFNFNQLLSIFEVKKVMDNGPIVDFKLSMRK